MAQEITALQSLIKAGDTERARDAARAMEGYVPDTEADWAAYYELLEKLNLHAQAEIATVKFLAAAPNSWTARLKLATRLAKAKKKPEAQAEIDRVMAAPVATAAYFGKLADALSRIQNWAGLIEVAEAGLRQDPDSFRMFHWLGVGNRKLGRMRQSVGAFETAIDKAGDDLERILQVVKAAEWLKMPALRDKGFARALLVAAAGNRPRDWLDMITFLKEYPAYIDQACNAAAAAPITDAKVLRACFNFAHVAGPPAAALALGKKLPAADQAAPDLAEKLARLKDAGQVRSSDSWWKTLLPFNKPK